MTNLVDDLTLGGFGDFDSDVAPIVASGQTFTVHADTWNTGEETIVIGEKEVTFGTRFRMREPFLSSITLRSTDTQFGYEGRLDANAVLVTYFDLDITRDGKTWASIDELALSIIRKANPSLTATDEHILQLLRGYGFDRVGRIPMYLQHLGADQEQWLAVAAEFMSLGATDNKNNVRAEGKRSEVVASYRHNNGPLVSSVDLSFANRGESKTNSNTGFIGFLDAAWGTLQLVLEIHSERAALRRVPADDPGREAADAKEKELRAKLSQGTFVRSFRNWGGTSKVVEMNILDDTQSTPRYFPQQVPCGKYDVVYPNGAKNTWNVWGSSRRNTETTTVTNTVDVPELIGEQF